MSGLPLSEHDVQEHMRSKNDSAGIEKLQSSLMSDDPKIQSNEILKNRTGKSELNILDECINNHRIALRGFSSMITVDGG